jgi:hypothetical protein
MSKVEGIGEQWQDVRNGLIKEVELRLIAGKNDGDGCELR